MHIVIVGAGLAGPLLAQGLHRTGHRATILEHRTPADHRRTGYRIHLAPQGDLALRSCLPPDLYELVVLTSGVPGSGVRTLDPELNLLDEWLVPQPDPSQGQHLTVDRQTLREILLAGLDDDVLDGAGFEHFRLPAGDDDSTDRAGGVEITLTDGGTLHGDLLVGADGAGSKVRSQLLPQLEVRDIGQLNIFGRTLLSPEVLPHVPPAALDGFSTVVGPGRAMPLAAHRFACPPQQAADRIRPGLRLSADGDYLMWVFSVPADEVPASRASADLQQYVADQVAAWHPSLRQLVLAAEPEMTRSTVVRTSRRPEPWPSGPVTVIGDAAHPMIPAGIGAAVALDDAARLVAELGAADDHPTLIAAVARYEEQMRGYGFDAVAQSEQVAGLSS
ncbi:FAD-dependent oxidoreductase [Microlunatus soli]|uniref:2-polyprenyl-6-methoxyphenol hydroxylase n=1 Tax=Microlunatus soli TaxID=630515 RepID=A0A1H1ZQK1_9ACTN|nr:NAD(P)/FAD-dependent oxidoreductase [Microlunatus soli]SDT35998.1 2-polyprenyl-6-methoxyphenol hydroxylase [Microlunatus soli]